MLKKLARDSPNAHNPTNVSKATKINEKSSKDVPKASKRHPKGDQEGSKRHSKGDQKVSKKLPGEPPRNLSKQLPKLSAPGTQNDPRRQPQIIKKRKKTMHVSIPFSKGFRHPVLSAFLAYRGTPYLLKHFACNAFKSFVLNL